MAIETSAACFSGRDDAVARMEAQGLRWAESQVGPERLNAVPHAHPFDVELYVLDGVLELGDPAGGCTHRIEPGGRVFIPAQTLHAELGDGFRAVTRVPDVAAK